MNIKYSIGVCRVKSSPVFFKINVYIVLTIYQVLYYVIYILNSFNHHSNFVKVYSYFPYFADEKTETQQD